jgi:hypothetical protein
MNLLEKLENGIEKIVEGVFIPKSSKIEPLEIARVLGKKMESSKILSVSKTYVDNKYEIILNEEDYDYLNNLGQAILDEFSDYLKNLARSEGWFLGSDPIINLKKDDSIKKGSFEITTQTIASNNPEQRNGHKMDSTRVLSVENLVFLENSTGNKFQLSKSETVLGRSQSSDIYLPSPKISRKHAKILFNGLIFEIEDLNSTNGTFLNGRKIKKSALKNGDELKLADEILYFRESD